MHALLAGGYVTLGDVQGELSAANLGDLDGVLRHNEQYMHLLEEDVARRPNDPTIIQRLTVATARLGQIEYARGNLTEALTHYQQFLAHSQAFADTQGDHFYARRSVAMRKPASSVRSASPKVWPSRTLSAPGFSNSGPSRIRRWGTPNRSP